mmetsp:Transcript_26125/g.61585  ORF Transcript_26125/g.61585 Transcript_26125/m.61585 type:complete len:229 (+) Transcript_26125:286-972(+)
MLRPIKMLLCGSCRRRKQRRTRLSKKKTCLFGVPDQRPVAPLELVGLAKVLPLPIDAAPPLTRSPSSRTIAQPHSHTHSHTATHPHTHTPTPQPHSAGPLVSGMRTLSGLRRRWSAGWRPSGKRPWKRLPAPALVPQFPPNGSSLCPRPRTPLKPRLSSSSTPTSSASSPHRTSANPPYLTSSWVGFSRWMWTNRTRSRGHRAGGVEAPGVQGVVRRDCGARPRGVER